MRLKSAILAILSLMLFVFVGCSDNDDNSTVLDSSAAMVSSLEMAASSGGDPFTCLDLTEDQIAQIDSIRAEYSDKFKELFESFDDSMSRDDKRESFELLRDEMHESINSVLTEEQAEYFEMFIQLRERIRDNFRDRLRDRLQERRFDGKDSLTVEERIENRITHLTEYLDLLQEQQDAVRDLLLDMWAQIEAAEDGIMNTELRRDLRQHLDLELQEIFTEDQWTLFLELRQKPPRYGLG